jgi:class 3 adenylate cyclase
MSSVRRLTAILAADVAGCSRLMGADEEGTHELLKAHRALVDPKITEHRGRIVDTTGDGMLVEFPRVVDAVRCAVDVQRGMFERNSATRSMSGSSFASGSTSAMSLSKAETFTATGSTSRRGWKHWPTQAGSASAGSSETKCATGLISPSRIWASSR